MNLNLNENIFFANIHCTPNEKINTSLMLDKPDTMFFPNIQVYLEYYFSTKPEHPDKMPDRKQIGKMVWDSECVRLYSIFNVIFFRFFLTDIRLLINTLIFECNGDFCKNMNVGDVKYQCSTHGAGKQVYLCLFFII
jgi:hypothetical protein